ncbi:endolytic transglycosylase MltG [Salipaludibacillus agaradhaerens]|uniref:endolytic transglycosylase MltG n=1 Tax=Salipaludibacillus agaradhaerens TaxID=76935 RepID=UPI000998663D|nr:endolytic transglycosylase MltG [Salipaludibacillus agaradhaerens]
MASKHTFRGIAAGLFLCGSLLAAIYYVQPETFFAISNGSDEAIEDDNSATQEIVEEIKRENEELHIQIEELKAVVDNEVNEDESVIEADPLYISILSIEQGMTSKDISHKLETLNIVQSAQEFEAALSDRGVAQQLQIGDYTLDSTMTLDEIIDLITSQ